jgi:hypothetical protein
LKQKILAYNGIISPEESERKPSILNCARCNVVNTLENKFCSKCSYPLVPSAYEELKAEENMKFQTLGQKYENDMKELKHQITESDKKHQEQIQKIIEIIQANPKLVNLKPEVLRKI